MSTRPTTDKLVRAAKLIGLVAGTDSASYCFEGRIAVPLEAGWSLAISPDDAGRFRVEACRSGRVRATMWARVGDDARLAELALAASLEAAALAV